MGVLLPNIKKAFLEDLKISIAANTAYYYAFASNPVENGDAIPEDALDDYSTQFEFCWPMIFGKRIFNTNMLAVVRNIPWTSNTAYDRYDNTKDLSSANFYVVVEPDNIGGYYQVYKCINNANNAKSTSKPSQVQLDSFTTADNYTWRYMYSIPTPIYDKFSTNEYVPIYPNTEVISNSYSYSGVEVVVISNSGSGYASYDDGIIRSISNSTVLQINNDASNDNDFYTNNAIFIFNENDLSPQLKIIDQYVSNATGNWVYLREAANTDNIIAGLTEYTISPRVEFNDNGNSSPQAYTVVNTSTNSISSIVVIDTGYGITRANAVIISNSTYGSGANVYCIVPPNGGHGSHIENELYIQGGSIYFDFNGSESNTISINTTYNKIGIIKNPYSLTANNTKGASFTGNVFSQLLKANVTSSIVFTVGETVTGNTSNSDGIVVFSNTTEVHLVGDKSFANGEFIISANGSQQTMITINTRGDLFAKEIVPLYVKNIDDVARAEDQIETFKVILQV